MLIFFISFKHKYNFYQLSVNENDCNKKESDKQVVESSTSEVEPAKNKDQELIVIQDSLYPIKLLVPGGEVVEIQVYLK